MERPEVICHMLSTADGKIAGLSFKEKNMEPYFAAYGEIKNQFKADAVAYGATTAKELFVGNTKPNFSGHSATDNPEDFISEDRAEFYIVVVDPTGIIPWESSVPQGRADLERARFVVLTSKNSSSEYLDKLRELGISYLISKNKDFRLIKLLKKLKTIFGIERLLLQGGGIVNGSFASEGLIDQLSLVISPFADCSSEAPTVFETGSFFPKPIAPLNLNIKDVERLGSNGLWILYESAFVRTK